MAWRCLRLEVAPQDADALSDALLEAGAQSVSVDVAPEARVALSALFASDADPEEALAEALERLSLPLDGSPTVQFIGDEDWVRASEAQFSSLRLGRLWIGASWHEAPSDAEVVRLDPGLAFGTGSHPTTRLVLRFLERLIRGGEEVLDYGCGSGILAIAAAKLGATRSDAIDIDPVAVELTARNAHANGVVVSASLPGAKPLARYDVLVANILAQPLIDLAPELARVAKPGAALALSGVLETQVDELARVYAKHFEVRAEATEDGWALLTGRRR
ncbi:MAG: 50S ribosomal protein L11 methyltransferase [Burkholderiales bacterium]